MFTNTNNLLSFSKNSFYFFIIFIWDSVQQFSQKHQLADTVLDNILGNLKFQ